MIQRHIQALLAKAGPSRKPETFSFFFFSIFLVLLQNYKCLPFFEYISYPLIHSLLLLFLSPANLVRQCRFYKCTIVLVCNIITSDQPPAQN